MAPQILGASSILTWVAARIFNRGSVNPYPTLVAAGIWNAIPILAGASGNERLAAALAVGSSGIAFVAAAIEFWLNCGEKLQGRRPMIFLLGLQAIALFLYAVCIFTTAPQPTTPPIGWFGIVHFVGLFYAAGSALFLVVMLKERREALLTAAALVDPLTGLANRRAFMDCAQCLFERSKWDQDPISLLMFDLDRFKSINDTFGHPVGDEVLRIFGIVLSRTMRPADIVGRIGGEEFAAALPGCGIHAGFATAVRISSRFRARRNVCERAPRRRDRQRGRGHSERTQMQACRHHRERRRRSLPSQGLGAQSRCSSQEQFSRSGPDLRRSNCLASLAVG